MSSNVLTDNWTARQPAMQQGSVDVPLSRWVSHLSEGPESFSFCGLYPSMFTALKIKTEKFKYLYQFIKIIVINSLHVLTQITTFVKKCAYRCVYCREGSGLVLRSFSLVAPVGAGCYGHYWCWEPVVSPAILALRQHKHQYTGKGRFHPGISVKALLIPAGCLLTSTGLEFRGRVWVGTWTQESSLAGLTRDPEDQG